MANSRHVVNVAFPAACFFTVSNEVDLAVCGLSTNEDTYRLIGELALLSS